MLKTTPNIPADFESYLMDVFGRRSSQSGILDDDMPDAFDNWMDGLSGEDYIKYANLFAAAKHRQGIIEGMVKTQNIALDVIKRVSF